MLEPRDILSRWFDFRRTKRHKYEAGYLLAIVGSETYPGAAVLSAAAAASSGVGGVVIAGPVTMRHFVLSKVPEAIFIPISLSTHVNHLIASAMKATAILVGCGLEQDPMIVKLVQDVVFTSHVPVVVDGGGLAALSPLERSRDVPWLLTPHTGEYWALTGADKSSVYPSHEDAIQRAQQWNATLLLKGGPSHVYTPQGMVYEYPQAHHAATTAGCGDVLAGLCGSFLAQGLNTAETAAVSIYLANKAAERASLNNKLPAIRASSIIDALPDTLADLA